MARGRQGAGRGRGARGRGRAESGYAGYAGSRGRAYGAAPDGARGRGRGRQETRERFARAEDGSFQRRRAREGEGGAPRRARSAERSVERGGAPRETLRVRADHLSQPRAAAFDAETASVDSASFVRDFRARNEE